MNRPIDSARDTDVLAALRTATASRHEWLDRGLPLSAPDPSLDDYAAHLRMVRDWLAPLESWLAGFADGPQVEPALRPLGRLALIQADLAEPGMPEVPPMRPGAAWPPGTSPAWRWGIAYVIEGSQLGGAVLYTSLARRGGRAGTALARLHGGIAHARRHPGSDRGCLLGRLRRLRRHPRAGASEKIVVKNPEAVSNPRHPDRRTVKGGPITPIVQTTRRRMRCVS